MEKRAWHVLLVADMAESAAQVRNDIGQGGILDGQIIWSESSWAELKPEDIHQDAVILIEQVSGRPGLVWLRACCVDALPPLIYVTAVADSESEAVTEETGVLLIALDEVRQSGPVLRRALGQALRLRQARRALQDHQRMVHDAQDALISQAALLRSSDELEAILASIAEIQISYDADFRFLHINQAAAEAFFQGFSVGDLLGRVLWEVFPQSVGGIFDQQYHQAMASGQPVSFETILEPDNDWYEVRAFPHGARLDVFMRDITARKQAELERERLMTDLYHERVRLVYLVDSLRTSEELYRATFDNASVGISHVSVHGEWLKVNDRMCEITGYSRAELLGLNFQAITYPDDLDIDLHQMQRMLRGELPRYQLEKRYIRKDGQMIWIHLSTALQRDEYDHPAYIISVIQDISGRKRLEAHDHFLIELGERLARAQSQAEIIGETVEGVASHLQVERSLVVEVEPGGEQVQVYQQDSMAGLLGFLPAEASPSSLYSQAILEDLYQLHQVVVEDTVFDPRTENTSQALQAAFDARAIVHTPFARGQHWCGMLSVFSRGPRHWEEIDLTLLRSVTDLLWLHLEKIRLLDSLRESEERLRLALSSSGVTVFGQDASLNGTWVYNPDASDQALSLMGLNSVQLLAPEDAANLQALKQHVLATGEIGRQELSFEQDGQRYYYQLVIEPARDAGGQISGILASALNISERRRAEEAIREYARRLERSNRDLEDFAFIASHDLQEPLRKVRSFGRILQSSTRDTLDETARTYLDRMANAAERMQRMIDDLLAYSRVTTKGQTFAPVDLRAIAVEVVGDLEVRIQQSGGQVELGTLPEVEGDRLQLYQLLQNLVANALKFHQPGLPPRVRVSCRHRSARTIELVVEDNGIGFSEQYVERIFQPFQRLHGRSEYEGSGIGLAICRKIAERHGGSITATSQPGVGSQFVVILPVKH